MESGKLERVTISSLGKIPYKWSAGKFGSRFLESIRENKQFIGIKCPSCEKVYVPPREICGPCFRKMDEWVELGNEGILLAYSIVSYKFIDPNTGETRPVPYTYGYIELDGASTTISHFIDEQDSEKLYPGLRVRAVFEEQRKGSLEDIKHFEILTNK